MTGQHIALQHTGVVSDVARLTPFYSDYGGQVSSFPCSPLSFFAFASITTGAGESPPYIVTNRPPQIFFGGNQ